MVESCVFRDVTCHGTPINAKRLHYSTAIQRLNVWIAIGIAIVMFHVCVSIEGLVIKSIFFTSTHGQDKRMCGESTSLASLYTTGETITIPGRQRK